MNYYIGGATMVAICLLFTLFVHLVYGDLLSRSGKYQRVTIVERHLKENGKPAISVRIERGYIVDVPLSSTDGIDANVAAVCVHITGRVEKRKAKARLAEMSECPLPVSRTMPRSGRVTTFTRSGKKTFRTMSSGSNKEPLRVPYPSNSPALSR